MVSKWHCLVDAYFVLLLLNLNQMFCLEYCGSSSAVYSTELLIELLH
jgi:hypothetical protein